MSWVGHPFCLRAAPLSDTNILAGEITMIALIVVDHVFV